MKKIFLALVASLVTFVVAAQAEHSIILDQSSFRAVQSDAFTGVNIDKIGDDTSRKPCARVKIKFANMTRAEVDALDVKFQSNTDLAKRKVADYYDNVLILEMTAKPNTRFYVKSPEYGESNEVTLNLEAYKEYEMDARLNQSFSIVVNSDVQGAEVYIDGKIKGRTDSSNSCTIKDVMIGSHTLKLVYGAMTSEQQIEVNSGKISFRQNVNIASSKPQYVVFSVEPKNSVITIDGQIYVAEDGVVVALLENGEHTFKAEARGYHSQSEKFTVAGSKIERVITLKGDFANVTIQADNGADIYINDKKVGTTSWSGNLNSGLYIFEARKLGYHTQSISKQITSDNPQQSYTLPALAPIYGSADINSSPAMADITIDGKSVGRTPLQLDNLLAGEHIVKISKAGYVDFTQKIVVADGKTTTVTAALTKFSASTATTSSSSGTYNIGDLVTVNGAQGIVFQTSPVVKIVSVKEGKTEWGGYGVTTNATNKDNGKANMAKIKSISRWETKYPAFKWCADYGNGWYLPALNELKAIYAQRDKINKTLSVNNMDKLGSKDEYSCLWSSSEYSDYKAFHFYFSDGCDLYKHLNIAVRAVLALDGGASTSTSISSNIGGFDMVFVKGGTFTMGATAEQGSDAYDWEKPTHSVTVSDYYIGKYEVTQAQWRAVMGSNPSKFTGDNNPVEKVSWNDIQEFIKKLNAQTGKRFRLPTEAEWEYAARGGNQSKGYKYSGSNNISEVAWYGGNSSSKTHPVGQKAPNELGIYDMTGNVDEWCQDWYGSYSRSSQTNPKGPSSGSSRVLRGGNWDGGARFCCVSNRDFRNPSTRSNHVGFRLVLEP